ncbi:Autophagy-related protein 23 [Podosphaera aphanis]|nr:Autophagy-related protein 23 [Podosphaera aphanis]
MFQRLKGAIDSRIAEEQARQKALATSAVSKPPSLSRTDSKKQHSPLRQKREKKIEDIGSVRGPDPSEFENAFVIEDDDEDVEGKATKDNISKETIDPGDGDKESDSKLNPEEAGREAKKPINHPAFEMPPDVRIKLRKLERLESKYQELLRSYRIAHARAISIEPFEKQLRENTPLSTISDPDALGEYLNQLNLKGDIIMDELKRISVDRDDYKKKFEESQLQKLALQEELTSLQNSSSAKSELANELPETSSSEVTSKEAESSVPDESSSFSINNVILKLQDEVKIKNFEIEGLKAEVFELKESLCAAQESNSTLTAGLEKASHEFINARELSNQDHSQQEKINAQTKEILTLKDELTESKKNLSTIELKLENQRKEYEVKLLDAEKKVAENIEISSQALQSASNASEVAQARCESLVVQFEELQQQLGQAETNDALYKSGNNLGAQLENDEVVETNKNKKKKKKKKQVKPAQTTLKVNDTYHECMQDIATNDSEVKIANLRAEIADKDIQISRLHTKRKTEEDLREEVENMQESLLNIGQEHVEAKEKIKELLQERKQIQETIDPLVNDSDDSKIDSTETPKILADLKVLIEKYEILKSESATIKSDLGATQQLATSRYRDIVEFRGALRKAQSELARLRTENADLNSSKEELSLRISELKRLEAREKDLRVDITSHKKQIADYQSEIRALHENITQEKNARLRAEDHQRVAQRDMRKSEAEKIQIAAAGEKSASKLVKLEEESSILRGQIRELEDQVSLLKAESESLRDEVELRGSQYSNTQGLLGSMRDEAAEMAMQLKEAKSQSESFSEELFEVQRLLSERTREGETMRRLLADVDDRAEAKVREIKEKMEIAIEERDQAVDEASTNGRRRAREFDELKTQLRGLERDLKKNIDENKKFKCAESDWKNKCEELEHLSSSLKKEIEDTRAAMNSLQDALNRSEKVIKETEKQKQDLRKVFDEANQRYEKLQKDHKTLQLRMTKINEETGRNSMETDNSNVSTAIDYVYLKTILLQFLEQKDRKVQESLIKTVLGKLLKFDKKEQERWIAAIVLK